MPVYICPECGNRGEPGLITPQPYAFQLRGRVEGKHVYKCGRCGAGLRRHGFFSKELTKIPTGMWTQLEREWNAAFPDG